MSGEHNKKGIDMINKENKKNMNGSIWSIFMHADREDLFLMVLGIIGAIGEGFTTPLILYLSSRMMNNIGSSSTMDGNTFIHNINKVLFFFLFTHSHHMGLKSLKSLEIFRREKDIQ